MVHRLFLAVIALFLHRVLSTKISGITAVGGEPVALDLFFENGARTCDCKVFRDVDSVLVITQCFPWKECYDILTNPTHVGPLGPLHIKTRLRQQKNVIPETIWQSTGPSVARRGDTVSTSSGSFVVAGNPAPYDHAVDLYPDAQYGDLPDDEPQTSSQIFTDVINEAFQLIGVSQNGVTPYTLLTKEQRMCTGPETFKDRHLYGYFKQGYLETTGTAFDRTANLLFPHPRSQPHYTKQGWGGFRDQFQELCWFPSIVTDKVYDYRAKSGQGWTSFGGLVGKARAISIGWNRKKRSLHAVTTSEPRDPALDEEAVRKWCEANPVEDEGMVDIVQQQLAPLAEGLAQRTQQYIKHSTGMIKDFQEEEESSDIEMKEEDEGSSDGGM
ncbi:hypothetical protein B0H14DRAFT_2622052 [Mycena olivaceomarginata]|nr:hypothetical protein B0H14DRAFT_2622052 [Mycena olivaceomarginata]